MPCSHPHIKPLISALAILTLLTPPTPATADPNPNLLAELTIVGRYETGIFDQSAAEIVAHDPASQRLFVVNAKAGIDILDIADPTTPTKTGDIPVPPGFAGINSIAVRNGQLAAAVEATSPLGNGAVFLYDTQGRLKKLFTVGVLPDSLSFTPDGQTLVVANEAQPHVELDANDQNVAAFHGDAPGSISIIDIPTDTVTPITFDALNNPTAEQAFRSGGGILSLKDATLPGNPPITVAQDLEPEYVAITDDGKLAIVSIQENNALAIVNLKTKTLQALFPLGFKDNTQPENALDPSNRDDAINLRTGPTRSAYMPDTIDTFTHDGQTYIITANEGDARDFDIRRVADLTLDPAFNPSPYPNAKALQNKAEFGRLEVSLTASDPDQDGDADRLVAFGARSFSIFKLHGNRLEPVFDSGNQFEQITAKRFPKHFNANNDSNTPYARSDDAGPEPEAVTVASIGPNRYAFIALERIGGVLAYDIADPANPAFLQYVNNRDFSQEIKTNLNGNKTFNRLVGDLGPEGLLYIPPQDSPDGQGLLVVANEVSGTTTLYRITHPTQHQTPGQ
ncbi:MAG: choice-of-anchor I family protein [Planctomycetota bacterium]